MLGQLLPSNSGLNIHQLFCNFAEVKLLFAYRGAMNDSITDAILGISEYTLDEHTTLAHSNRKVSFLLVECFQNILRHGQQGALSCDLTDRGTMFSFRLFDDAFYINSINRIAAEDRERLTEIVDRVNRLDKKELKALYLEHLQSNDLSDRGGAGLGLIELARKSGRKIGYRFEEVSPGVVYFHNQVCFKQSAEKELDFSAPTGELQLQMLVHNTLMVYKGDLSQRSILPLLSMAEVNLQETMTSASARKVGHVLVEMLQNVSRHSNAANGLKEGVMTIAEQMGSFVIQTGNVVTALQKQDLDQELLEISKHELAELREMHRAKFKASLQRDDRFSSGLGLLQIARDGKGRIDFRFDPMEQMEYFFSFAVMV